jgi:hypothetical protein
MTKKENWMLFTRSSQSTPIGSLGFLKNENFGEKDGLSGDK